MSTDQLRDQLQPALTDRYVIEREIGRGGMATVFLARDLKHDRPVALKVLDPELGAVLGAERFLSEIRVTANLQHPNLLPLFDSGSAGGLLFYVMPFVQGESLRHRLERERQLPVDEAVRLAIGVLGALDYAHQHRVIHRDLKPENILLQHGEPVVADFGIALAVSNAGGQRVTQTGLSLGTPQYMSPEQATGDRVIDGRTDLYSLGAVLYEMLTGEPPHVGATAQAVIARLMTEEPRPVSTVRRAVPPHVDDALSRALEKLPADRFETAKQFADALRGRDGTGARSGAARRDGRSTSMVRRLVPWIVGTSLGVIAGAVAVNAWRSDGTGSAESLRFTIDAPAGMSMSDVGGRPFALSGDGRAIAFTAGPRNALFVRRFDQLEPVPVADVERPADYAFSDDGNWLAFNRFGALKKVWVGREAGTAPTLLADSVSGRYLAWTRGPNVLFTNDAKIWSVPAAGGKPRVVATDDDESARLFLSPTILGDGKTVAYRVSPTAQLLGTAADRLGMVSLEGGAPVVVDLAMQTVIAYTDGFLIYGSHDGRILGVRFDLAAHKVMGEPVTLLENVVTKPFTGVAAALAANGTFAYMTGAVTTRVDLVDERGATLANIPVEPRSYWAAYWSPEGRRLLLQSMPFGSADLWVYDTATRVTTRLTQSGDIQFPRWTPDGKRVVFLGAAKRGNAPLWVVADGSAPPEFIPAAERVGVNTAVTLTSDGKYLLASTPQAIAIPLDSSAAPIPLLGGGGPPRAPVTSPDGRWMAYSSAEGGRREVYVRPFPTGEGRVQLSLNGGDNPEWSRDGRHVFYRTPGAFRAATLDVSGALPRLVRTDSLFPDGGRDELGLHPDGKRFTMLRDVGEGPKLIVVTHWLHEALAKLRAQ